MVSCYTVDIASLWSTDRFPGRVCVVSRCHPHAYSRKPESGLWTLHRVRDCAHTESTRHPAYSRKQESGLWGHYTEYVTAQYTVSQAGKWSADQKLLASDSDDIHLPTICNGCYARVSQLSASRGTKHLTRPS